MSSGVEDERIKIGKKMEEDWSEERGVISGKKERKKDLEE